MDPEKLHTQPDDELEEANEKKRDRNAKGIANVLRDLQESPGQQKLVQKGETLEFFESTAHHRRRGERMTNWLVRFDAGMRQLRKNRVDLSELDDVAG
eukprot:1360135-Pyramimonas_sp.AAC.1